MTAWVEMGDEAVCPLCGLVVDKPEASKHLGGHQLHEIYGIPKKELETMVSDAVAWHPDGASWI